jgi:two-component system KDP operon response regulator KdpE
VYVAAVPTTVLLVEDEPDLVRVMTISLTRAGFEVLVCGTSADAVEILGTNHVDVLITDRGLPDADGTALVRHVRQDGFTGAVLIVSGRSGPAHDDECRAAGADGVLAKPFRLAELVARLESLAPPESTTVACVC